MVILCLRTFLVNLMRIKVMSTMKFKPRDWITGFQAMSMGQTKNCLRKSTLLSTQRINLNYPTPPPPNLHRALATLRDPHTQQVQGPLQGCPHQLCALGQRRRQPD